MIPLCIFIGFPFRITHIGINHVLFQLLDDQSKAETNWLIWLGSIKHDKEIKVTHFGPFGKKKKKHFEKKFEERGRDFSKHLMSKLNLTLVGLQELIQNEDDTRVEQACSIMRSKVERLYRKMKSQLEKSKNEIWASPGSNRDLDLRNEP